LSSSKAESTGVGRATRAARASGQSQWVARVVEADAVDMLRCYANCGTLDRFIWERRESGDRFVAWGRVDEIESAGDSRFGDVEAWAGRVGSRLHWTGIERPRSAPVFFGGFGFEDDAASAGEWKAFPAARFVLPAVIGEFLEDRTRFTLLARVEPGTDTDAVEAALAQRRDDIEAFSRDDGESTADFDAVDLDARAVADWPVGPEYRVRADRAHSVFSTQVGSALEAIEAGVLDKIVLARRLRVEHDGRLDIPGCLGRLRDLYPSCTLVAMGRGEDTFLAATPETLIRVRGDQLETAALAGSAPRGRTPEEDLELGASLQASAKERAEHAHVVDALRHALGSRCTELEIPKEPRLRKLFGIQHLETPIFGRIDSGADPEPVSDRTRKSPLLRLVAALHPTPAVGGVPRESARNWLRRHEGLDRGWYASPVGWLDAQGGGDFCVALRSALIQGASSGAGSDPTSRAWLFAGAGIVAGSKPESELAETRIKLRALLAPLTEI
jgi:isochorismate synthase